MPECNEAQELLAELLSAGLDVALLYRMLDRARAAERERCAAACDDVVAKSRNALFRSGAKVCAGEIRALPCIEII